MKIERRGTEVEIMRNKRKGLKLIILDCSSDYSRTCNYCYLYDKPSLCLCGDTCYKAQLLAEEYFIHKK